MMFLSLCSLIDKKNILLGVSFTCILINCTKPTANSSIALENVSIVDVRDGSLAPGMTIIVTDSIISVVGQSQKIQIPSSSKVIDGSGKYVIPGLWDMHVHLGNGTRSSLPLFIANGVTGVRDMGTGSFDSILKWRAQIYSQEIAGPRIISSGPILNGGQPEEDYHIGVNTPKEARQAVDSLAALGVDFIKVQSGLSREVYYAIANMSKKVGLPYAGHIPISGNNVLVDGKEASDAGQHSLEHMLGIPFARDTIKAFQNMYPSKESLDSLFTVLKKNNTYVTPTLLVYEIPADYENVITEQDSLNKYVSADLRNFWESQTGGWPDRNKTFMKWLAQARSNMVPQLQENGVSLLSGTDVGFPYVIPGFGLHKELSYLVQSGLSTGDVLMIATLNAADYLGLNQELGTIERGKLADLVILNENPLINIKNLKSIHGVVTGGKLYDRAALDSLLQMTVSISR